MYKRGELLLSFNYRDAEDISRDDFQKALALKKEKEGTTHKFISRSEREYMDKLTYENIDSEEFNLIFHKSPVSARRDLYLSFVFMPKLEAIMHHRNQRDLWENDREHRHKISTKDSGNTLFWSAQDYMPPADVDIYEYGKDGLEFVIKDRNAVKALPACQDYFYRDWDRGGFCIKSTDIFVKRAYAIISPESVKDGDYEETGMIDLDEGVDVGTPEEVANYLSREGAMEASGCPPGAWYENSFTSNPDDETQERTSYHIYNADKDQEKEIFKKLFPLHWKAHCPDI